VLIRALEPTDGLDLMRERRGRDRATDLCSGPGKLTQALGIELALNATTLTGSGPLELGPRPAGWKRPQLAVGPRIGITRGVEYPWRFAVAGNRHVSSPRPG
jgi:DNA-3-methyladenine glycosylase